LQVAEVEENPQTITTPMVVVEPVVFAIKLLDLSLWAFLTL
jgi:hypothetical protein